MIPTRGDSFPPVHGCMHCRRDFVDAPCTFGRTSGTACIRELGPTASTPCACAQRGYVRGVSAALIRPHTRSPHLRLACASFPPTTRSCLPREARTRLGLAATDVDAALGLASPRARPRDRPRSSSASGSAATDFEPFSTSEVLVGVRRERTLRGRSVGGDG